MCVASRRRGTYGRSNLVVTFELVSTAAGLAVPRGTRLSMWCRLGPGGHIPSKSKWARMWCLVAGRRPTRSERRMTTAILRGKLLRVAVRTVIVDDQQRPLAPVNQYSIIDHILAVETGGGRPRP